MRVSHRAVRSACPETAVGVEEALQAHGLVPVGVAEGSLELGRVRDCPVALLRGGHFAAVSIGEAERTQALVARFGALPFLQADLPEPAAQPLVEPLERQGGI